MGVSEGAEEVIGRGNGGLLLGITLGASDKIKFGGDEVLWPFSSYVSFGVDSVDNLEIVALGESMWSDVGTDIGSYYGMLNLN